MVLKLTRTDIAFVKGQKKMMDSFRKKIEKEMDKITLANTAIADWNEKIESIDKFTVGLYGKTVTEIMGIIDIEEQTPLIVQDKATGEYVPNPEAVVEEEEEKEEEKEEETPEVEEEQIPESVPNELEDIKSEPKIEENKEETEEEKETDTPEDDNVPFEEELGWPDEDSDESPAEEEEKEEEAKDPMEDSEWPDPDYPDDWN